MTRPQDVSAEQHRDHPSIGSEIPRWERVGDGDRAVVRSSVATAVPEDFESIEDVFENSYCHSLALALHERTGWPIVGLYNQRLGTDHYLVRRPDGFLVDVHGARPESEVLDDWADSRTIYSVIDC